MNFEFIQAMKRPFDYHLLSERRQWEIDNILGILDWNGSCGHSLMLCDECSKKYWKTHKKLKRES